MGLRTTSSRGSSWSCSSAAVAIIGIAALACMLLTAMARLAMTSPLLTTGSLSVSNAGDSLSKDAAAVLITKALANKAAGSIAVSSSNSSDAAVSMWNRRDAGPSDASAASNATTTIVSAVEELPAVTRRLLEAQRNAVAASHDGVVQQAPSRLKYAARLLKQVG